MVNGGLKPGGGPRDLRLQGRDAGVQLVDRPGIEILAADRAQRVVRPFREKFVHVHNA